MEKNLLTYLCLNSFHSFDNSTSKALFKFCNIDTSRISKTIKVSNNVNRVMLIKRYLLMPPSKLKNVLLRL